MTESFNMHYEESRSGDHLVLYYYWNWHKREMMNSLARVQESAYVPYTDVTGVINKVERAAWF